MLSVPVSRSRGRGESAVRSWSGADHQGDAVMIRLDNLTTGQVHEYARLLAAEAAWRTAPPRWR